MVTRTYLSKFNTIISNSTLNTGISPISELIYGRDSIVSRALIYFDHNKVKELMENNIMVDMSKMKHTLHITNAGSLDFTQVHGCQESLASNNKQMRATSFDLIFFLIPKEWDNGKGFNYTKNGLNTDYYSPTPIDPQRLISTDGCNWFQRMNGLPWDEEGIYTNDHLSKEYDKFAANEDSIVIGRQHFDMGNENIELDITETFNKFLNGELENYGIGIAYSPMYEITESKYENYLGLLTDKTNTFFQPYVETRYNDVIMDDRSNFVLDKNNRLYLYCNIGDTLEDLDYNPIVTIKNNDDEVIMEGIQSIKQQRGVYYIELNLSSSDFEADTMLYDTWGGIVYQGTKLDDVELDFTLKQTSKFFNIGNASNVTNVSFTPTTSGINQREQLKRGDIRKLVITARPNFTTNTTQLIDFMEFRLYVKDGTSEIDVISWDKVNKTFSENFYIIDTNILIPQRYYADIKITYGMNSIVHHDVLSFDIVNDLDKKYR